MIHLLQKIVDYMFFSFPDVFKGVFINRSKDDASCIFPKIHVYGFSKSQDPEFDFHEV